MQLNEIDEMSLDDIEDLGRQDGSTESEPEDIPTEPDPENNLDDAEKVSDEVETDPEDETNDNPNRQGLIRTVKGAHLAYKRKNEDGTFDELWIFNSDGLKTSIIIKKAILAGTDIPVDKTSSDDNLQTYKIWSSGNIEMIEVKGLPN